MMVKIRLCVLIMNMKMCVSYDIDNEEDGNDDDDNEDDNDVGEIEHASTL